MEDSETESRASSHQSKRQKYSTEPTDTNGNAPSIATPTVHTIVPKSPVPSIRLPDHFFTPEDITRAQERAKEIFQAYEKEKVATREAFEAAQKRATRRCNDAEQKLIEAGQEFAMKIKVEKAILAQEMTDLKSQNEEKQLNIEELQKDKSLLEQDLIAARVEIGKMASFDNMQKQNQKQAQDLAAARAEIEALKTRPLPNAADNELRQRIATQESQLKLYDRLRESIVTTATKPRTGMADFVVKREAFRKDINRLRFSSSN